MYSILHVFTCIQVVMQNIKRFTMMTTWIWPLSTWPTRNKYILFTFAIFSLSDIFKTVKHCHCDQVAVTLALESWLLELNPLESINSSPSKHACQCDCRKWKTQARLKFDMICLKIQRRRSKPQTHYQYTNRMYSTCLNPARMYISSGLDILI